MFGRAITVMLALTLVAMALEARAPGAFAAADSPALRAAALALFVILASALPRRLDFATALASRGGGIAFLLMIAATAYAHRDDAGTLMERLSGAPRPSAAVVRAPGVVELRQTYDGHFRAYAEIGEAEVEMMLDTGASIVLLRHEDAVEIGLDVANLRYTTPVTTANGQAHVAAVTLERIRIGDVEVRRVRAAVAEPGKLQTALLGMTFLGRLEEVSIRRDTVTLRN